MNRRHLARLALTWGAFAILIGAAIFIRNHQVDRVELEAPIDVRGNVKDWLVGRNIAGTVTGAQLTEKVIGDYGDDHPEIYEAHPDWTFVMFDVRAQSLVANATRVSIELIHGDNTFGTRYVGIGNSLQLTPGIPTEGRIGAFEIPEAAAKSTVLLQVTGEADPSRDSRLVFAVDLTTAQHVPSLTVNKRLA